MYGIEKAIYSRWNSGTILNAAFVSLTRKKINFSSGYKLSYLLVMTRESITFLLLFNIPSFRMFGIWVQPLREYAKPEGD